jgi:hypothetical protein
MTNNYLAATSMVGQILCSTQPSSTGETTVYTVPSNETIKVASGVLCNTSTSSAVTVSVSVVPSGGTADSTHRIISGYSLAFGDSMSLKDYLEGTMMGPGDFISVNVGTASLVDVVITGTVVS